MDDPTHQGRGRLRGRGPHTGPILGSPREDLCGRQYTAVLFLLRAPSVFVLAASGVAAVWTDSIAARLFLLSRRASMSEPLLARPWGKGGGLPVTCGINIATTGAGKLGPAQQPVSRQGQRGEARLSAQGCQRRAQPAQKPLSQPPAKTRLPRPGANKNGRRRPQKRASAAGAAADKAARLFGAGVPHCVQSCAGSAGGSVCARTHPMPCLGCRRQTCTAARCTGRGPPDRRHLITASAEWVPQRRRMWARRAGAGWNMTHGGRGERRRLLSIQLPGT